MVVLKLIQDIMEKSKKFMRSQDVKVGATKP